MGISGLGPGNLGSPIEMCVNVNDRKWIRIWIFTLLAAGTDSNVIGTVNIGDCYLYSGLKLTDEDYAWFSIAYHNGQDEPVSFVLLYFLELGKEVVGAGGGGTTESQCLVLCGLGSGTESASVGPSLMSTFNKEQESTHIQSQLGGRVPHTDLAGIPP